MPAGHHRNHPDVHQPWAEWSEEQTLHILLPYQNPCRWETRRKYFNDCYRHLRRTPNVAVHRIEVAYGNRPHEVTGDDPLDIQLRTHCEMFHKENLMNVGVWRLPPECKYVGYWDADFHLTRHDWALEAIHMLQRHHFVQLFSSYGDLSAETSTSDFGHRPYRFNSSFAWNYNHQREFLARRKGKKGVESAGEGPLDGCFPFGFAPGAAGGGWAWTQDAYDGVGGMLDICVLGSGDEHMAMGLVGANNVSFEMKLSSEPYIEAVRRWQLHARCLNGDRGKSPVGCVDNFALHFFHGSKSRRGYIDRRKIFQRHDFNPLVDLVRDHQGLWQWAGNKPALRDEVRAYLLSRREDDPTFVPGVEKEVV